MYEYAHTKVACLAVPGFKVDTVDTYKVLLSAI